MKTTNEFDGWHVIAFGSPVIYECRKGGLNSPVIFGPSFKTIEEARAWIKSRIQHDPYSKFPSDGHLPTED